MTGLIEPEKVAGRYNDGGSPRREVMQYLEDTTHQMNKEDSRGNSSSQKTRKHQSTASVHKHKIGKHFYMREKKDLLT